MQVGFFALTVWSFLMASAHGAGLMILPVLLGPSTVETTGARASLSSPDAHAAHTTGYDTPLTALTAVALHTVAFMAVTGLAAWLFYAKLGLAVLRQAWVNLDLIWAAALIATAGFTLLV